jgi:site-specific recombinase XerC
MRSKNCLGHSQIATTVDIYGHLDFKTKQKMAFKMNERGHPEVCVNLHNGVE